MGCPNCKCNKNKISEEEYNELKEYLQEKIKEYRVIDYISKDNKADRFVEVEFEDYILELEDIDTKDLNLDKIIDNIIRNEMV
jgi:predicted metal-binding transcription factor (methanogenesis marker protein 9)